MLLHPTIEKLRALKLPGMARALEEQQSQRDIGSFTFEERLGLLLDHESTLRDGKVLAARLSRAKLKLAATPDELALVISASFALVLSEYGGGFHHPWAGPCFLGTPGCDHLAAATIGTRHRLVTPTCKCKSRR